MLCYTVFFSSIGFEQLAQASIDYSELSTANWGRVIETQRFSDVEIFIEDVKNIHKEAVGKETTGWTKDELLSYEKTIYDTAGRVVLSITLDDEGYEQPTGYKYDAAGNLTKDKDGYEYEYDYENRIVKITKGGNDIAEQSYDCLGRRVEKKDCITAANTRRYYYSYKWQVLNEYDGSDSYKAVYVYGNYIDEVLVIGSAEGICNYIHDHLYSTVALTDMDGGVVERYEYDVYGNYHILEPNFADDPDGKSDYGNFSLFAGRRVDIIDNGSLKIQYNRNRYLDYYTGRWLTEDPAGYADGLNLYEYVKSNPILYVDPIGFACDFKDLGEKAPAPIIIGGQQYFVYGDTYLTKMFNFSIDTGSKSEEGCEVGKRKFIFTNRECAGEYWYAKGYKKHEQTHVNIYNDSWSSFNSFLDNMESWRCMCEKKYECFMMYAAIAGKLNIYSAQMENAGYDMDESANSPLPVFLYYAEEFQKAVGTYTKTLKELMDKFDECEKIE